MLFLTVFLGLDDDDDDDDVARFFTSFDIFLLGENIEGEKCVANESFFNMLCVSDSGVPMPTSPWVGVSLLAHGDVNINDRFEAAGLKQLSNQASCI